VTVQDRDHVALLVEEVEILVDELLFHGYLRWGEYGPWRMMGRADGG